MTPLQILALISLLILLVTLLHKAHSYKNKATRMPLYNGQQAPDFTLPDQNGIPHTLSSFRGKKVALCFYPKDGSPFCTAQMCNLRDNFALLQHHTIDVIGINSDSEKKHKQFKTEQTLPFLLLSDPHKQVTHLYNAAHGPFGLTERVTILIDETGAIVNILKKVDVSDHAQQIINEFVKKEQTP